MSARVAQPAAATAAGTAAAATSPALGAALRLGREFAASGAAVGVATAFTNPLDVIKVQMQLQSKAAGAAAAPQGLVGTAVSIARADGAVGFARGLSPALVRAVSYGGLRLGLYAPLKEGFQAPDGSISLTGKLAAGCTAGAAAAAVSNPLELAKVRLQAVGAGNVGFVTVIRETARSEGVPALWKGTTPAMARAACLTASQCASYDEAKRAWKAMTGMGESFGTHLGASMISGLVATTVTAPVDVLKTKMQAAAVDRTVAEHCLAIAQKEGMGGFFKGWMANYMRLGPQTTLIFLTSELIRSVAGMKSM